MLYDIIKYREYTSTEQMTISTRCQTKIGMTLTHGDIFATESAYNIELAQVRVSYAARGAGTIFFLGGGKHVDMPSDCQNLGGHRHIHPLQTKSWGAIAPLAPPAPAPLYAAKASSEFVDDGEVPSLVFGEQ